MDDQDDGAGAVDEVPENVEEICAKGVYVPPGIASPEEQAIYERALAGHCMLCDAACGASTTIIVNRLGVIAVYCSQVCAQDMINMNFMAEIYDDMKDKVEFRNQEGNN